MFKRTYLITLLLLTGSPAWSQIDSAAQPGGVVEDRMVIPTPVGNQANVMSLGSETGRTNYLQVGATFGTAYDDNIFMTADPVHDVTYSVAPSIALKQSRSLTSWNFSYSPGFTFYQHYDSRNEADHNISAQLEQRLSPHVTLTVLDNFLKTSNVLNQVYQSSTGTSSGGQIPPDSVIAPIADRWSNVGSVQATYQFTRNGMIGVSGDFSKLRYTDRNEASGLYDSTAQSGKMFYAHRLSGRHYIGGSYVFQRLLAYPGNAETQTHSFLFFYTLYLQPRTSLSFFAGPEHSDTFGSGVVPLAQWTPALGGTFAWQSEHRNLLISLGKRISQGGGLPGAVQAETALFSFGQLLTRNLTFGTDFGYSNNTILSSVSTLSGGGHSWSGGMSLERSLGERLAVQLGYTRLHQTYTNLSSVPDGQDRNRVWVSVSYKFERPLGR